MCTENGLWGDNWNQYLELIAEADKHPKISIADFRNFGIFYDMDTSLGPQNRYSTKELDWIVDTDGKIIKFLDDGTPYTDIIYSYDEECYHYCYDYAFVYRELIVAIAEERGRCGGVTDTYKNEKFYESIRNLQNGEEDSKKLYEKLKGYNVCGRHINLKPGKTISRKEFETKGKWIELIVNYDPNLTVYNLWENSGYEFKPILANKDTLEEIYNSEEWKRI